MINLAISGASGLIGSSLTKFFTDMGCPVRQIKREEFLDGNFDGIDVIIHLAGSSIAKRWTKKVALEIKKSRVESTEMLVKNLSKLASPPKIFLCASAVGFYGDTGDLFIDESGEVGGFFLSEVCNAWERASDSLKERGVRVVHCRFGTVLSPNGGMLKKILPLFKKGVGGSLGNGKQYMSWIAIEDVIGALYHVIQHNEIEGAINIVSPCPVSNKMFTELLCKKIGRPVGLHIPVFVLKMLWGRMASEILLSSSRIEPKKLVESGYLFKYPDLSSALVKYLSIS
jgi:uncharacterized protein (TIGR01777 family)